MKEYGELLPQGPETPEHHLFTILDQETVPVGVLWFAVKAKCPNRNSTFQAVSDGFKLRSAK